MKSGKVEKVEIVGSVSNRTIESLSLIGIWNEYERQITAVWEKYKNKELEKTLNKNRKTEKDYEDYVNGKISKDKYENGEDTINWLETYCFFPCLHDDCLHNLTDVDPELFFKEIEEPYNYNASFVLEHYDERRLIFNDLEYGLGTWDMVMDISLRTFAPYSKQAIKLLEKIYDLDRFLKAQERMYPIALQEVRNGKKTSHWMWYIFPQMKGLGKSKLSQTYGIRGRQEADAYIKHPILRDRLVEICEAVLNNENTVYEIFGSDAIKVRSCVLLFASVSDVPVFKKLKSKYAWL